MASQGTTEKQGWQRTWSSGWDMMKVGGWWDAQGEVLRSNWIYWI